MWAKRGNGYEINTGLNTSIFVEENNNLKPGDSVNKVYTWLAGTQAMLFVQE
jgi:hypothetical protein